MKNYSELTVTSALVRVELELVNNPVYTVSVAGVSACQPLVLQWVPLANPFTVEIDLLSAGTIHIKSLQVDGIELIPKFDYLATYRDTPTSQLDHIGRWRLTFDRPFYQWLHQITGQGWLLDPL